ncbi:MAG: acetate--CoA ligase family protein [Saprospiraceae bacterium]
MINTELISPKSIVVVGGSNNTSKPGGKVLENLISGGFKNLYVINPTQDYVQGIKSYGVVDELPQTDLAILAISAKDCLASIMQLHSVGVKAFIIISAGFSEFDQEGKDIENEIFNFAKEKNISVFGPNCIGIINDSYKGAFTLPIPGYNKKGINLISSSGSTAVFMMEAGMKMGMQFSDIYSVGNAMMIDVEDILEYLDDNYIPGESSPVIALYLEQISDSAKLIKHSRSLINKGCNLVGIKSGITDAGGRAASSHTGAMATSEVLVQSIFQKAGIIQCDSREELLNVAGVLFYGKPKGKNLGIITHAGGAGVLCADAAEKSGLVIPELKNEKSVELLEKLHFGSSVKNPIDFLATGNKEQLSEIIDYCNDYFDNLDEMVVIFGSPGLFDVSPVYDVLSDKIDKSKKPIYPVLPSPVNTEDAINEFCNKNKVFFPDEVVLAKAIGKTFNVMPVFNNSDSGTEIVDESIKKIVKNYDNKYLTNEDTESLLGYFNIPYIPQVEVNSIDLLKAYFDKNDFPVVMKAVGILHKSDRGGVILNIDSLEKAENAYNELMKIEGVTACTIQKMIGGMELYAGSNRDKKTGNLLMFGLGGIFLEILKDTAKVLSPVTQEEVLYLFSRLKSYKILQGARGKKGIDLNEFSNIILNLSRMTSSIGEISELDLNPLIATDDGIYAVDCRIKIN